MNQVGSLWCGLLLGITSASSLHAQTIAAAHARPITLREALEAARNHPAVQASAAAVRAAQGMRRSAGAWPNPMLAYQVENAALPGRSAPPMDREAMTMVMLPLHSLYQRWPLVQRANADLEAAIADATRRRQEIALAAARAFYRTALAQIGVETARDLVTWLDSVVSYNRVRVREGVAAEADLIRSELERDRASAEEAMQAAELARAAAELSVFVSDTIPVIAAFDSVPLPRGVPGDAIVAQSSAGGLISARPDVVAARLRLSAAAAGIRVERSMIIGDIDATLGLKQTAGTSSLIAGASLPFPLFNQNRGEVARASAERDVAAFELAALERGARAELRGAAEAARILTDRAEAFRTGFLTRADEARRIAFGAYQEGAVPLIQVIDASRAWGEARRAYYGIVFAQHTSILDLLVARGVDISDPLHFPNR